MDTTQPLSPEATNGEPNARRLALLLDVNLDISVELGRSRMSIQELLGLGPGSVIELDKLAGEPLDILVNDRLIARGEAVVMNDKFGVRITDIVNPTERVARLR
jgi:flagellar motor switch protein FliN/FliY